MLKLDQVDAGYGRAQVLRSVSLEAKAGEITCLLGRNGAGKTTTLKAIMQVIPLMSGAVYLESSSLSERAAQDVARSGVGYVPQGRRLFGALTVAENLDVGRFTRPQDSMVLEEVFELFPRLRERSQQRANTLSGGEQQMLAMARALCLRPKVVLLDEPTEGLQPSMMEAIRNVTRTLRERGVAVVLVEQRIEAILDLADHAVFLENGQVVETVPGEALRDTPQILARHLGV
ncbi:ABC transporter ATP-binding protein [Shimia marina]|uniref:LIV-I protein F n=1 Tax=Shimia marina TaxID=321267 RepID=A0A0P1ETM5_9RHOB|nr:ABC transporter ATP-binding protein [Shimia marina]CUH53602.1 LIV-I protein F [Shimia marina]SFD73133.1 amino acid/amide ABC transporter ATP-binding protein 2, HAAT family [Shimia marina]